MRAVRVAVSADDAELAADALWQAGAAAIEEQPGALVAATVDGGDPARLLAAVAHRWPAEAITVDLDGALDAWREHARAVAVGDRLVVRPPWVARDDASPSGAAPPDGPLDVVVDPGRAFGHGAHPTTRLVLDALVTAVRGGERVLDVGCGSGVLAIAALALGARTAVGVDVDPAAIAATRANAARNGVADRVIVVADLADLADVPGPAVDADLDLVADRADPAAGGELHELAGPDDLARPDEPAAADRHDLAAAGRHDLVVANMLASQLVAVAPTVVGAVAPGGTVVLSGLLTAQRGQVLAAYRPAGPARLAVVGEREDEGWLCLTLRAG